MMLRSWLALTAAAGASASSGAVLFGLYDAQISPGGGWTLASAAQLNQHHNEFVSFYNANGGLPPVKTFQSANCCIALKGGQKLTIAGTKYDFQFPADANGKIACNPEGGYHAAAYQFYMTPKLTNEHVLGEKVACVNNHNPGVFIKLPGAEDPKSDAAIAADNRMEFGLYRLDLDPGNGWRLLTKNDLAAHGKEFVASYNALGGINAIKVFTSKNCCIAMSGGLKLTIYGSTYDYQFPASPSGGIRCNPKMGYTEGRYKFYKGGDLEYNAVFGAREACATNQNPALFIRAKADSSLEYVEGEGYEYIKFGLYDLERAPAGGWTLLNEKDLVEHKDAFVAHYNNNGGIHLISTFQSVNCCVAMAGGKKIAISGTKYTYQFLGSATEDSIRCNPEGGYKESLYRFFKTPELSTAQVFSAKDACSTSHNPAVYKMLAKVQVPPTPRPTAAPTRAPTPYPAVHCTTSPWSAWSDCSAQCGHGTQRRSRTVRTKAEHGGVCPPLAETRDCEHAPCPVACAVGDFGEYSDCNAACGGGAQTRTRDITRPPVGNGAQCPHLQETKACNTEPCPVHCTTSPWSSWSECDKPCNGGKAERRRIVTVESAFDGEGCGDLVEEIRCNVQACNGATTTAAPSTDCVVSDWSAPSACSTTCGKGTQKRTRSIVSASAGGGQTCPTLVNVEQCDGGDCPVGCTVTGWEDWGSCSLTCGTGFRERKRSIGTFAENGGAPCPSLVEIEPCNSDPCPVDCMVSAFGDYTQCTKTCGSGSQTGYRSITRVAEAGGIACPALSHTRICNAHSCPVHCTLTQWGDYGACDKTCGASFATRTRQVKYAHAHGGQCNGALKDDKVCERNPCPRDCVVDDWQAWGACSVTCGEGTQTRKRATIEATAHGGQECPAIAETRACRHLGCQIDCKMSLWSEWSACSKTCGTGFRSHERGIDVAPAFGGMACGPKYEIEKCASQQCPVDCVMSSWGMRSGCTVTCGTGTRSRSRTIVIMEQYGGKMCPPELRTQSEQCDAGHCPQNCNVSPWGDWDECPVTCGGAKRSRARTILQRADGGSVCPSLTEEQECGTGVCPIDCIVASWGTWNPCSRTCGTGYQGRSRKATQRPNYAGKKCPDLEEHRSCATNTCPVNCEVNVWGTFSACNKNCGGGTQQRSRDMSRPAMNGGRACPERTQTQACNVHPCARDCQLSGWAPWSGCTVSCGTGSESRSRTVLVHPMFGGASCGSMAEERSCETQSCPVDCLINAWSDYGECSRTCGGGLQTRSRGISREAATGGVPCGAQEETRTCKRQPCPIDCAPADWGTWSACSASCEGGTRHRSRTEKDMQQYGGLSCPSMMQTEKCGTGACPVHCATTHWSQWSVCSKTCGGGKMSRSRSVLQSTKFGGQICPLLFEEISCSTDGCPVDCVVTDFTEWTQCTHTCGGGSQTKTRRIKQHPSYGGKECPVLTMTFGGCAQKACPVDCKLTQWGSWNTCAVTCGGGISVRRRSVEIPSIYGGQECAALFETQACNSDPCPADCLVGDWGPTEACTVTCGRGGYQSRHRQVTRVAEHGGKACPDTTSTFACDAVACPTDCKMSAWNNFSPCTQSCGTGGKQFRTRHVVRFPRSGGVPCPDTHHWVDCNRSPCPVHCEVSSWSEWTSCTKTCGTGLKSRSRSVVQKSANEGTQCPKLSSVRSCAEFRCPTDCVLSTWSDWTTCTRTCGTGTQQRTKMVTQPVLWGGKACATSLESRNCATANCPVNCVQSDWREWTPCTKSCGGGTRKSTRSTQVEAAHGGVACGDVSKSEACNAHACPADCKLGQWGGYGSCSKTCGTGRKTRTRKVISQASEGGKLCAAKEETLQCGTAQCPVDCSLSTPYWAPCSKTCGGGIRRGRRAVLVHPLFGGVPCSPTTVEESCEAQACPVDCQVGEWQDFSACTKTCGGGLKSRSRSLVQPSEGGKACPSATEELTCFTYQCPIECVLASWSAWTECSRSCGTGRHTRGRSITTHAQHGGSCIGEMTQHGNCNTQACPSDCKVSTWFAWGDCSTTCGAEGVRTRTREERVQATNGGKPCPSLSEEAPCGLGACPVHCEVTSWGTYQECSSACGGGQQKRTRTVTSHALNGGYQCPSLSEARMCNTEKCGIDCHMGNWDRWGPCDAHCGPGQQKRKRTVIGTATHGGSQCPTELEQSKACLMRICPTTKAPTPAPTPAPTTAPTPLSMFEVTVQAEDATTQLSHGAVFDNAYDGYTGDGYVDFGNNPGETVTWKVDVPETGRYELRWRYALNSNTIAPLKYKSEHIQVNHKYNADVSFTPTATGSWSVWQIQSDVVELHAGINFITLETTDSSGPHVDALTVDYMKTLQSCTPGQQVPLTWFLAGNQKTNIFSDGAKSMLGNALDGTLSGNIDLGAVGPWDIKFQLAASGAAAKDANDYVKMTFNGRELGLRADALSSDEHGVSLEDNSGHLSFKFNFESMNSVYANHMAVLNGVATCKGCSHVRCRYVNQEATGFKRIQVYHHSFEKQGGKHKCGWNHKYNGCMCNCGADEASISKVTDRDWKASTPYNVGENKHAMATKAPVTRAPLSKTSKEPYCAKSDWYNSMKFSGWSTCRQNNGQMMAGAYLTGLFKGKCEDNSLGCMTQAKCCDDGVHRSYNVAREKFLSPQTCYEADWSTTMKSKGWSMCSDGYYLSALKRGGCGKLHCLEAGRCCKSADTAAVQKWETCYSTNVWGAGGKGWKGCNDGFFMTGLFRGDSNLLNGFSMVKCCQPANYVASAAP